MKNFLAILALAVVVLGPLALRPKGPGGSRAGERSIVVITPHNESIRYEFGRAFARHHEAATGERVRVDFRSPGGTSEITRFIDGSYVAAFENHWRNRLGRPWTRAVETSFANGKVALDDSPEDDTPEQQARRAFLESDVGCGIDVFFGGGAYDFAQAAAKGQLVDSGILTARPDLFGDGKGQIPQKVSGEPFYDPKGLWTGAVISAFGIVSNRDVLEKLGVAQPTRWADLADPRFFGHVALANPTQSSSIKKAFEMLIQQQIAETVARGGSVEQGWIEGLRLIQKIGANARYFTDSSTKPSLDVGAGDAAAGMTIDFYARFQAESVGHDGKPNRLRYSDAEGGTSVGVDPIALLRGSREADLAKAFIAFVLSEDGQKLWNWQVGAPGGPERYALRRMPMLPSLYGTEYQPLRSDPGVNPYELARRFTYRPEWTASLFTAQGVIVRAMCIDSHAELTAAWSTLVEAGFPPKATAEFQDLEYVSYAEAKGRIREALGPAKIAEVRLAKDLSDHFRAKYRKTLELARRGE